ncbi:MAG: polysaccharide deacetylase [Hyphomicrobiales bacterium]|nr:polysaccharide deacetylase [Hyphomicrobiales bacterium]
MIQNPVPWPNGARCAVAFTFDMDADSILHLAHPDRAHQMVATLSMLRYGPLVAVPRILETWRKFNLKQTFFVPAWCIESYPGVVEAIVRDGHEIGHHGYIHEHPNELSRDEELYWLQRGIEVIVKHTGQRPRGWRAPLYNFSNHSLELLLQEAFLYDASLMGDDVPYLLRGKTGELVELPSHWGLDDWPQFTHSLDLGYQKPIRAPERAWEVFWAEFEAAVKYGGLWIAVWHPMVSGRLARWHRTEKMIESMLARGDVWIATLEEIARHVRACIGAGTWKPRVDELPYYDAPVRVNGPVTTEYGDQNAAIGADPRRKS